MRPYQEEYIANVRAYAALTADRREEDHTPEDYAARMEADEARRRQLIARNMELLRGGLLPQLDHLLEAGEEELAELGEFAGVLYDRRTELDVGLFCHIHQSLLNLARQKEDRQGIIRELYWLGIGRHAVSSWLVGLDSAVQGSYLHRMRLCFTEAAAYLKYFEEIEDEETRSYIMRSVANMALGQFPAVSQRTALINRALQVLQDPQYQELAPRLPWERFVRQTRQLMISSLPHSPERSMTARDVADIMEAAQTVYRKQLSGEEVPVARQKFHLYSIDYCCGIFDLNTLLTKLEELIDGADHRGFSHESMYALISLPAFYSQYVQQDPKALTPRRQAYIAGLYQRILEYVSAYPEGQESETLFLYLRQLTYTFVEVEGAVSFADFLCRMLARFAPDIYIHSCRTAAGAEELCRIILEEEPGFFDDMEPLRAIAEPEEKRRQILDYARDCGLLHDVGKVNFLDLYSRTARQWFPEEYETVRLHTLGGGALLSARESTARCAVAALGHHSWYDGSHSSPGSYRRLEHPERQMVDVIALVDFLADMTDVNRLHTGEERSFDQAVEEAVSQEGKRFSPMVTVRLREKAVVRRLWQALCDGKREAWGEMYRARS